MRKLLLTLMFAPSLAWAQCPATPWSCPAPTYSGLGTFARDYNHVSGADTRLGLIPFRNYQTFGTFGNATGVNIIANAAPNAPVGQGVPQVNGFVSPSGVATNPYRDGVALYTSNTTRNAAVVVSGVTYDATHVFFPTPLASTQVAAVPIGSIIDTGSRVASFTGAISGTALTATAVTGSLGVGDAISGIGVFPGTAIVAGVSSPYTINAPYSSPVSAENMTATNPSLKFSGTVTAIDANKATVSGWFQQGNQSAGQSPSGVGSAPYVAYLNVSNHPFSLNTLTYITDTTGPDYLGATGVEEDVFIGATLPFSFGTQNVAHLYIPSIDSVPSIAHAINLDTPGTKASAALYLGGEFARGILTLNADYGYIYGPGPTSGFTPTAFLTGQTTGDFFTAAPWNTGVPSLQMSSPSTIALGRQSGIATEPILNFYSSASGTPNPDAMILVVGGTGVLDGVIGLQAASVIAGTTFHGPTYTLGAVAEHPTIAMFDNDGTLDNRTFLFVNQSGGLQGNWVNDGNSVTQARNVTFLNNGNTGFGTTTPSTTVEVNGVAKFDSPTQHGCIAFASLPTPVTGMTTCVTDSTTNTWGAAIAGSGANTVFAFYNGANWTVMGK